MQQIKSFNIHKRMVHQQSRISPENRFNGGHSNNGIGTTQSSNVSPKQLIDKEARGGPGGAGMGGSRSNGGSNSHIGIHSLGTP